jgi:hypothetical protein
VAGDPSSSVGNYGQSHTAHPGEEKHVSYTVRLLTPNTITGALEILEQRSKVLAQLLVVHQPTYERGEIAILLDAIGCDRAVIDGRTNVALQSRIPQDVIRV